MGPGTRIFAVLKRVFTGTYYDGFIHAGNLAYMAMLALFPFFIVLAAVLSALGDASQRDAIAAPTEEVEDVITRYPITIDRV